MNEFVKYCLLCCYNHGGRCTRFEPCYKKPTELIFVGIVSETKHGVEMEKAKKKESKKKATAQIKTKNKKLKKEEYAIMAKLTEVQKACDKKKYLESLKAGKDLSGAMEYCNKCSHKKEDSTCDIPHQERVEKSACARAYSKKK